MTRAPVDRQSSYLQATCSALNASKWNAIRGQHFRHWFEPPSTPAGCSRPRALPMLAVAEIERSEPPSWRGERRRFARSPLRLSNTADLFAISRQKTEGRRTE